MNQPTSHSAPYSVTYSVSYLLQLGLILIAWVYVCWLHYPNDGMWPPDASRHAGNGIFWLDYLSAPSLDPQGYALSYYARYPMIKPSLYPPAFYWLEAAVFGLFGPDPHAVKTLVLLFALFAAIITLAWIRRRIDPAVGWVAALLLLLPGMVTWSHAIMLNVPSSALSAAALYFGLEWLTGEQQRGGRARNLTAVFGLAAILVYYQAAILLPVLVVWWIFRFPARRRSIAAESSRHGRRRPLLLALVALLPCAAVVVVWTPEQASWVVPRLETLFEHRTWFYYLDRAHQLFDTGPMLLAAAGAVSGMTQPRWRRETLFLLTWCVVVYAGLSLVQVKDVRYLLSLAPACVLLIAIGASAVAALVRGLPSQISTGVRRALNTGGAGLVLLFFAAQAWTEPVPIVTGVKEVAQFYARTAGDERVFYDDELVGIFSFYVRAQDPEFRRQVIRGGKLLYAYAVVPGWRLQEFVESPAGVIDRLRVDCGCRWLAVEQGPDRHQNAATDYLRTAVAGPEFELVQSFKVTAERVKRIDIFKMSLEVENPEYFELPFPVLGPDKRFRAKPITR